MVQWRCVWVQSELFDPKSFYFFHLHRKKYRFYISYYLFQNIPLRFLKDTLSISLWWFFNPIWYLVTETSRHFPTVFNCMPSSAPLDLNFTSDCLEILRTFSLSRSWISYFFFLCFFFLHSSFKRWFFLVVLPCCFAHWSSRMNTRRGEFYFFLSLC